VKVASDREIRFYERVSSVSPILLEFVPKYHGVLQLRGADDLRQYMRAKILANANDLHDLSPWTLQILQKEIAEKNPKSEHILISDITRDFRRPNIIDIKLGTLHHSQNETKPTKYATAVTLGYCLGGCMMWDEANSRYLHMDKYVGRMLTDASIGAVIESFFAPAGRLRRRAVRRCVSLLERLLRVFDTQTTWRFHSTSLLIVYEGDDDTDVDSDASASDTSNTITTSTAADLAAAAAAADDHNDRTRIAMSLVDFAHAYMNHAGVAGREPQVDEGCRLGIRNLLKLFKALSTRAADAVLEMPVKFSSSTKWTTVSTTSRNSADDTPRSPLKQQSLDHSSSNTASRLDSFDSEDGLEDVGPDDVLDDVASDDVPATSDGAAARLSQRNHDSLARNDSHA